MNPTLRALLSEAIALHFSIGEDLNSLSTDAKTTHSLSATKTSRVLSEIDALVNFGDLSASITGIVGDLGSALGAYVAGGGTPAGLSQRSDAAYVDVNR